VTSTRLLAFAKLNLSLAVLGRRPDGYHEIDTLVQTVDLADHIEITVGTGRGVTVENSLRGIVGPDLAERAATALLAAKRLDRRVEVCIRKGIPAGAGLGGGSSDAAAVLAALNRLTPHPLGDSELTEVAAGVGSDVPLLLRGGCLRARGRGEILSPLPASRRERFVVVAQPVHSSTADVYAALDTHRPLQAVSGLGQNDLLDSALFLHPELRQVADAVARCSAAYHAMSGSGAAFYAAFAAPDRADDAARRLAAELSSCVIRVCRPTDSGSAEIEGDSV